MPLPRYRPDSSIASPRFGALMQHKAGGLRVKTQVQRKDAEEKQKPEMQIKVGLQGLWSRAPR